MYTDCRRHPLAVNLMSALVCACATHHHPTPEPSQRAVSDEAPCEARCPLLSLAHTALPRLALSPHARALAACAPLHDHASRRLHLLLLGCHRRRVTTSRSLTRPRHLRRRLRAVIR